MWKQWKQGQTLFSWLQSHCRCDCSHKIQRRLLLGRKTMTNLDSALKNRDIILLTKVHIAKCMVFPLVMYGCESWTIKKAGHRRTDAFELWCWWRLLDCKEIKPVNPNGNWSWIFIRITDAEAEAPIHWPPDVKSQFIRKDAGPGKDWRQEEKGTTEDEIVGWHHWLDGHEFEQALGDGEGQESLMCCIHGVTKSWTWLINWMTTNIIHCQN